MSKPTNFSYSNNLISTKQPLVATKGKNVENNMPASSAGIIGGMSRPNVNLGHAPQTSAEDNYNNAIDFIGVDGNANRGRANPIKHWRRQLQVRGKSGKSAASISVVDRPGGTVFRGYMSPNDCKCDLSGNNIFITFDNKFLQSNNKSIKPPINVSLAPDTNNTNKIQNNGFIQIGVPDISGSYHIQTGIYNTKSICCSQAKKSRDKTRSITLLSKSYYGDTKAYLKARCNLFEQKQSIKQISTNTYTSTTIGENSTEFSTNNCTNPYQTGRPNCQNVTYYNPNNTQFATQGAVDSSTRLARLNYNTITRNGASCNTAKEHNVLQLVSIMVSLFRDILLKISFHHHWCGKEMVTRMIAPMNFLVLEQIAPTLNKLNNIYLDFGVHL
jgi:hypothetical protein